MSFNSVRRAQEKDLPRIHELAHQLGYPSSLEIVTQGFLSTLKNPDYEVVVLEEEGIIQAWMTLCERHRIEDVSFLQIAALVTEEKKRGSGYGKKLLAYAETQAITKKLSFVGLYSSKRRTEAHQFYEKFGYQSEKESLFFVKKL